MAPPSGQGLFVVHYPGSKQNLWGPLITTLILVVPRFTSHGPPPGRAYLECITQVLNKTRGKLLYHLNPGGPQLHFSWATSGQGRFGVHFMGSDQSM